jgi:RimJ/RimL family protein N-acetyltransferase
MTTLPMPSTLPGTASGPRQPGLGRVVPTERLVLRPATIDDADPTYAYRSLEPVARWLTELPDDVQSYRARFVDPERLASTVMVELDGQPIGDFMLRVDDAWAQSEVAAQARGAQAELGWVLDPRFVGHGYATEAVRALLAECFTHLGVRRVVANAFADNHASCRLMERVGMRRETYAVAESLHRGGVWLDTVGYAILEHEWRTGPAR